MQYIFLFLVYILCMFLTVAGFSVMSIPPYYMPPLLVWFLIILSRKETYYFAALMGLFGAGLLYDGIYGVHFGLSGLGLTIIFVITTYVNTAFKDSTMKNLLATILISWVLHAVLFAIISS